MLYHAEGGENLVLSREDVKERLGRAFTLIGERKKVLALPPDFTRYHSQAGMITELAWEHYGKALTDVMPALGTHSPMTDEQIKTMFGRVPANLFRVHNFRTDLETLGEVPASFIREVSEGKLDYPWPAQVNKLLAHGGHDLILSVGQVVPHEVVGMANHNKNIFVGTGGTEGINKSHYLGAVYGMERMMGRADTPVRRVLDYASNHFAKHLPIVYVLTVVGRASDGKLVIRGLYIGDDEECFKHAAELSLAVNFTMLEKPIEKAIVYLDPDEFKSTWLGNKAIYRTRMVIADGGELVILAPGVREFGEDKEIDRLIRKYGYIGTERVLESVKKNDDLKANLSAAAHLIHGSSEGRFTITYCPGHLTQKEVEGVNFRYGNLSVMGSRYDIKKLKEGPNSVGGEEIYYISNPAIGLWAYRGRFKD
jgi:nickel-dependent lactate racemase